MSTSPLRYAALTVIVAALGCSSASPEGDPSESGTSSASSAVGGCSIGGGQCLSAVQAFYGARGIGVGVAPGSGAYDAQGRWCAGEGACLIWVSDIPSQYGWHRTASPSPFDIAVFPPRGSNPYGHITIVHHVDASGAWMIDANDALDEAANNTPHLHYSAPYGYYHYSGGGLESCGGNAASAPAASAGSGSGAVSSVASCRGLNDALYCGYDHVHGDPSTLYRCSGGVAYIEQDCANGCTIPQNTVEDDFCN